jgi:hypothetical protein
MFIRDNSYIKTYDKLRSRRLALTKIQELKKIVQDHERRISKLESSKNVSESRRVGKTKRRKSRFDLIVELKEEGFFNKPKSIGEIAKKCTELGYYTTSTDLTGPLQRLVRSKILRRIEKDGKWVYVASRQV